MGLRLSFSLTSHYEKYLALSPGRLQHNSNSSHITHRVETEKQSKKAWKIEGRATQYVTETTYEMNKCFKYQ